MRPTVLREPFVRIFGADDSPIMAVEERAREAFPDKRVIVWQGDPQTFIFDYVGGDAESVLGHAVEAWLEDGFWATHIVHPDDRDDAVAFCALATAKACDHEFEYRAVTRTGETVWLLDIVRVQVGRRGVPVRLRGIMLELPAGTETDASRRPSLDELALV